MQITLAESISGAVQNILHRILQHLQLVAGILRELDFFGVHLFGRFHQVYGMVADALKIADGVQQGIYALAVGMVQLTAGKLDEIGAESVLVTVYLRLFLADFLRKCVVPLMSQAHGLHHAHTGKLCHFSSCRACTFYGHGRGVQQAVIQQRKAFLFRRIRNGEDGQLFQQVCKGQQHQRCHDIEHRVHHSDAPCLDGGVHKSKVADRIQAVKADKEDGHTDDVEVQMDHGSTACILVGTHRGDQRGNAGADVLTHDNGNGTAVGDHAGGAQRLQNTHAGAGALDDAGNKGTHQNAQKGVGKAGEQAGEPCLVLQGQDGVRHGGHASHQHGKADEDGAHAFFLLTLTHIQQNADKCKHRAERSGLEHLDDEAVALQAGQAQDPAGDRGAHVAAHDDADGLVQFHDAAVDKAHHHDGGGAGTLDNGGDAQTQEEALDGAVGQLAQDLLQLAACLLFQRLAHDVHTEQEQGQAAQQ